MKLIKTTAFSAIITFIRISSGFVASKIVAIFTGASGVALVGAFNNFITVVLTFANGAINNGIVKFTSEYEGDADQQRTLFSTALKISVISSIFIGILLIILAPFCSKWIFYTESYATVIRVLGATIMLYSLNTLLISILNGKGQIKTYTIVNTSGSIIGLVFTIVLVYYYKIQGALYALALSQSIVFFITVFLIIRSEWFAWQYFNQAFNKIMAKKLSHYTLMALVASLCMPISQILLRNIVVDKVGLDDAGYWQGIMRISDGYLYIITISLNTYYLPKLSSLKQNGEIRAEIFNGYKIVLPFIVVSCSIIYFLRFFIINLLYTKQFVVMEKLFLFQLIGDFFKIAAWLLSYLFYAKTMTREFVFTEILFSALYVGIGYFFVSQYQLQGITVAFALNYFLYFCCMLFIFRKLLFGRGSQFNAV